MPIYPQNLDRGFVKRSQAVDDTHLSKAQRTPTKAELACDGELLAEYRDTFLKVTDAGGAVSSIAPASSMVAVR